MIPPSQVGFFLNNALYYLLSTYHKENILVSFNNLLISIIKEKCYLCSHFGSDTVEFLHKILGNN